MLKCTTSSSRNSFIIVKLSFIQLVSASEVTRKFLCSSHFFVMEVVGDGARDLHLRLWPEVHLGIQPRICTAVYSSVGALLNSSGPSTHLHAALRPHSLSPWSSRDSVPLSVLAVFCMFGRALNRRALNPLDLLESFQHMGKCY